MKHERCEDNYINGCTRNKRTGTEWLKAGVSKLRGIRKEYEKGKRPICVEDEDVEHILLTLGITGSVDFINRLVF
jgi:hypothetical protein